MQVMNRIRNGCIALACAVVPAMLLGRWVAPFTFECGLRAAYAVTDDAVWVSWIAQGIQMAIVTVIFSPTAVVTYAILARIDDAAKAVARCAECGYVLLGLTQPRCPECGAPFNMEERDKRT